MYILPPSGRQVELHQVPFLLAPVINLLALYIVTGKQILDT